MLSTTGVMAESTMYVGDKVKIPMRADASIAKNNVINHLSINTPVTLIKKQANGWSNIKVDGKSGWMISRYLTDKKPSNLQAEKLKKRIISMSNHNKDKREQVNNLQQQITSFEDKVSSLELAAIKANTQSLEFNKLQNKLFNMNEVNTDLIEQVSILKSANGSLHTTDFLTIISTITLLLGFGVSTIMSRVNGSRESKMYTL
ncbi:TIGR04211 family SH3 domain-containing protein [Candidatus Thioglobus sp.]|jgi:SH3 domain protein|uniref:TIGR04211 family SH3 domain-containing protein n=1 Tax=Candidatus Thioglobus sp. TaxID=2026721 RepID=UPI0025BDF04A|nr:TIGR04211 family SH3 domain-containing protein [Candidatus Thioglobus sp.]